MNGWWVWGRSGRSVPGLARGDAPPNPPRLEIEVRGQAMPAALPPEAGLAVPAERARGAEPVVGVGPHHAGPQPPREPQDPAAPVLPEPRGQPPRRVVGPRRGLRRGAERWHRQ